MGSNEPIEPTITRALGLRANYHKILDWEPKGCLELDSGTWNETFWILLVWMFVEVNPNCPNFFIEFLWNQSFRLVWLESRRDEEQTVWFRLLNRILGILEAEIGSHNCRNQQKSVFPYSSFYKAQLLKNPSTSILLNLCILLTDFHRTVIKKKKLMVIRLNSLAIDES